MAKKAKVTVNPDYKIGKVEDRMYSFFMEPIFSWVYGGVWNPEHPTADEMGFRKDIIEATKEFGLPAVRTPGGNFVSGWEWKDSIGPKDKRKKHLDLAWHQYEPNIVGHDEYLEWAKRADVEPMYTFNMATDTILSAVHCIEYTNHPGGTYWSDLRKENGYEKPHDVKIWYLGNEIDGVWQIGSYEKDPRGYGNKVNETSKAMKWVDPNIETVVAGSSTPYNYTYPDWDVQVLEQCYETVDYLSLHYYHVAPKTNVEAFLTASEATEVFLKTAIAACDLVQAKLRNPRKMMISFDEYANMMTTPEPFQFGRTGRQEVKLFNIPGMSVTEVNGRKVAQPFREVDLKTPERMMGGFGTSEILNALTTTDMLMTFVRHADRVKIACMTAAVSGALAYDKQHVWKTALYHTLHQMSKYGRGMSLMPVVDGPTFNAEPYYSTLPNQGFGVENAQYITASAVQNDNGEVSIFLINRSLDDGIEIDLDVRGFDGYKLIEHIEMFTEDMDAKNSYENQNAIKPVVNKVTKMEGGKVKLVAQKLSWNVVRLGK